MLGRQLPSNLAIEVHDADDGCQGGLCCRQQARRADLHERTMVDADVVIPISVREVARPSTTKARTGCFRY